MKLINFTNDKHENALLINLDEINCIRNEKDKEGDGFLVIINWKNNSQTKVYVGSFEEVKEFLSAIATDNVALS
jgi:hypothetical protein